MFNRNSVYIQTLTQACTLTLTLTLVFTRTHTHTHTNVDREPVGGNQRVAYLAYRAALVAVPPCS